MDAYKALGIDFRDLAGFVPRRVDGDMRFYSSPVFTPFSDEERAEYKERMAAKGTADI